MTPKASIIEVITTPLGFFALALLIVESFLGTFLIGAGSGLSEFTKLFALIIAELAFLIVVVIVTALVWRKPLHLTLQGREWNERARDEKDWGSSDHPQTKKEAENLPVNVSASPSLSVRNKKQL